MKIARQGDLLTISELSELCEYNSDVFSTTVRRELPSPLKTIEVDLSQTRFVDSCGLGALLGLQKSAQRLHGKVQIRLVNPPEPIQQLFELTRMHRLFDVVQR